MIDFEALAADGSWQLTWSDNRLEEAVFRLSPSTAAARGALVEQLDADANDPEQWEATLIEALLTDPTSAGLRRLELHLKDFHHSARRAARALAGFRREQLTVLYFGHDFECLFEPAPTSAGSTIDPLEWLHEGFVDDIANNLWEALPALRELSAEGGLLFDDIDGKALPELTELRLRGAVFADGAVFPQQVPSLRSLTLEFGPDVFGTVCPGEQLAALDPAGFPALRHLDLGAAEFDTDDYDTLVTLADSPLLPQLESLTLRSVYIHEHDIEGDRPAALAALAPAFAHLTLTVADGTDDDVAALFGIAD
ncbi:hypothetical protein ACFVUS_29570 [Nocardia sp. NPDC058058]|uniref:hypothetical protein n=1 Tax=Nocardia sp. NPDC058058 TaxID=3346317 RepID=UPI0036DA85EE